MVQGGDGLLFSAPFSQYDLFTHFYTGGGGYGDPLNRDPKLAVDDLKNGHTTLRTVTGVNGIVLDPDSYEVDIEETETLRKKKRQERLKRAITVENYKKQEREKIIKGHLHKNIKDMYKSSFKLSNIFRKEFIEYWNLPEDFTI